MTAIITDSGRVFMARHLMGLEASGITHCALGAGDETFVDPSSPPIPRLDQTALLAETARKRFTRRQFLTPDAEGSVIMEGIRYAPTESETSIVGIFFEFTHEEVNGLTIREYGFFGGDVAYRPEVAGDLAMGGVYDPVTNPGGEVLAPGRLFQLKTVPDFYKQSDTTLELVCACHI